MSFLTELLNFRGLYLYFDHIKYHRNGFIVILNFQFFQTSISPHIRFYSSSPKILFSMMVDTLIVKPSFSKLSWTGLALSEWQTIVVRASAVNSWLTYLLPALTMSAIVVLCMRRIFAWFMSVIRLPRWKQTVRKFSITTISRLFSCSTSSKINELFADSNNVSSHVASCNKYVSYSSK